MDLTTLSNDELAAGLRDHLVEVERRLTGRRLKTAKLAHALLEQVEQDSHDAGDITTLSVGGDKP